MKKREQGFLTDLSRSLKLYYPEWDYFKIPDGGTRFTIEKPCDSTLHIDINDAISYFPIEAKSVKGASRFDISKIEDHQWDYLEKYSNKLNSQSFFLVHYDIPRHSFFNIYTYSEMKQKRDEMKSIPYAWVVANKTRYMKNSDIIEGKRKPIYEINCTNFTDRILK